MSHEEERKQPVKPGKDERDTSSGADGKPAGANKEEEACEQKAKEGTEKGEGRRKQDANQGTGKGRSSSSQSGHSMQEGDGNAKPSNKEGKEDEDSGTNHAKRQTEKEASFETRKKLKGAEAEGKEEHVRAVRDPQCTSSSRE